MRTYKPTLTADEGIDRNLQAIAAVLSDLQLLPIVQGAAAGPAKTYVDTAAIASDLFLVVFSGASGKTLTLPAAAVRGAFVAQILIVRNDGAASVAIAAVEGDTVSGSATVNAGVTAIYVSDGATRWLRAV